MALTNVERQAQYRAKIRRGELRRLQVVLPLETAIKIDYLTQTLGCNATELLGRLILEEWERQGKPVPGQEDDEVTA